MLCKFDSCPGHVERMKGGRVKKERMKGEMVKRGYVNGEGVKVGECSCVG